VLILLHLSPTANIGEMHDEFSFGGHFLNLRMLLCSAISAPPREVPSPSTLADNLLTVPGSPIFPITALRSAPSCAYHLPS